MLARYTFNMTISKLYVVPEKSVLFLLHAAAIIYIKCMEKSKTNGKSTLLENAGNCELIAGENFKP